MRLKAATPKFEVKRHGSSDYSNDCRAGSPGGYSASNIAGSAISPQLSRTAHPEHFPLWAFLQQGCVSVALYISATWVPLSYFVVSPSPSPLPMHLRLAVRVQQLQ